MAQNEKIGRGDLNEGLQKENYNWEWQPMAQERSSDAGFSYEESELSLDKRPRQARLTDAGASSENKAENSYYYSSQKVSPTNKREVANKNGKDRKRESQSQQRINAEENQEGQDDSNRPDRDCNYLIT